MKQNYKDGDVVLIVSTKPSCYGGIYSWTEEMDKYLGRVVTITDVWNSGQHGLMNIRGDRRRYTFGFDCIERMATTEEIEKEKEKIEEENKLFAEKYSKFVYTADTIGAIANDVFGDEMVDIRQNTDDENRFSIIVRFPHITITNSNDSRHEIKDLYVMFSVHVYPDYFDSKGATKMEIRLDGRRGAVTLKEFDSDYSHSHLGTGITRGWSSFCLGSSAFKVVMMEAQENPTHDNWTLLFLSLLNYVKWESLEGGPHKKIESLYYSARASSRELRGELNRLLLGVPKNVWEIGDGVKLNTHHPDLYNYFNKTSKIRTACGYSKERLATRIADVNVELVRSLSRDPLIWKGKPQSLLLLTENVDVESTNKQIDKDVVYSFCTMMTKMGEKFFTKKSYNDYREKNRAKVFLGETGTFKQAPIESDTKPQK